MLDDKLKALWARISPPQKAAFFGCFLSGYLVHLYVFTNIIPNSDGLSRIFDPQQMTVSGRWFLHFASYFNGFTQMPAVIGLFSVLFLALAAALAVSLLGIRSRALSALSGALMAAFPAVGYTFLYLFTASAYCFAIFLAVLSVSLARRGRWHWLAGCLLLACSMGTYQAYVTVAIGLSLLVIFRETLDPSASFSATLRLGVRLMLFLAAGAVLYYGILLVFLQVKDLELLSYLGMDAASSGYPFSRLPGLLLDTYKQVAAFSFLPGSANTFTSGWMAVLDLAALALGGGCFLLCMGQEGLWRARWRPLGGLAMLALLPLGINFGQILSPWSAPTPLMKYAFVLVYLAVVLLAGSSWRRRAPPPCGPLRRPVAGPAAAVLPEHQQPALHRLRPSPPRHPQLRHPAGLPHRELPRLHPRDAGLSHRLFPHRPGPQQRGGLCPGGPLQRPPGHRGSPEQAHLLLPPGLAEPPHRGARRGRPYGHGGATGIRRHAPLPRRRQRPDHRRLPGREGAGGIHPKIRL